MKTNRVTLLIRRVVGTASIWQQWGTYPTVLKAQSEYEKNIQGKGVTAWAWWGPTHEARKMLADPTYTPKEE